MNLDPYLNALPHIDLVRVVGRVVKVVGLVIEAQIQGVSIGDLCQVEVTNQGAIQAEVVGFKEDQVLMMPLGSIVGIRPGSKVFPMGEPLSVSVGNGLLGRILNGLGEPIDGKGPIVADFLYPIDRDPPDPFSRPRIKDVFSVGVRSIDGVLTLGKGQRIGIFAGSGVGKSTLMGMIARNCSSQVNVICLVGERGREVNDFIEESLGPEGLKKSVVICATSDTVPLIRAKCPMVGTAVAEYFRDQGNDVLFMMDSVTRFAMAQREIGLATGEPPTTKGYTPSVFAMLPRLMERSGTSEHGTITAIYTVLVDGGDFDEPIADAARGILDGHISLSRDLAAKNHYPCIDIGHSVSRLFSVVASDNHKKYVGQLREILAQYDEAEDLINIGAYIKGSNPKIDRAIAKIDVVNAFLKQRTNEAFPFNETIGLLASLFR
jgi:flagellum-specific ATP synthase